MSEHEIVIDHDEEKTVLNTEMTLVEHLTELRKRILISLVAVGIGSCISYIYIDELVRLIAAPAGRLYYMNPAEAFFAYLKVSIFTGFLLAWPIVMYQTWAFIVPGLTENERKASGLFIPVAVALFYVGATFSYCLVFPVGVKFFIGFATEGLQPLFSLGQYLSFFISCILPFCFIFELPLLVLMLVKVGTFNLGFLQGKRKFVLVSSFIAGALLAPAPDVFSQTMVAIPMIILYEISVLLVKYILRGKSSTN